MTLLKNTFFRNASGQPDTQIGIKPQGLWNETSCQARGQEIARFKSLSLSCGG